MGTSACCAIKHSSKLSLPFCLDIFYRTHGICSIILAVIGLHVLLSCQFLLCVCYTTCSVAPQCSHSCSEPVSGRASNPAGRHWSCAGCVKVACCVCLLGAAECCRVGKQHRCKDVTGTAGDALHVLYSVSCQTDESQMDECQTDECQTDECRLDEQF